MFDFDGTLVLGDSLLPFLFGPRRKRRWRALAGACVDLLGYATGLLSDRTAKERLLVRFLAGATTGELEEQARAFAGAWVASHLHPVGAGRLREHQTQGHRVILLSASPDVYVLVAARSLGIDEVVCTRVEALNGRSTGRLLGDNCKGERKLAMLQRYLGTDVAPEESFGYGDSHSDLPVLRWLRHGYLVTRRGLETVAPA